MTTSSRWDNDAPCKGKWELFFPEVDSEGNEIGPTDEARAICAGCPLVSRCLDEAITARTEYGIAGGLDAQERESLRVLSYRHTRRPGFMEAVEELVNG